MGKGSMGVSPVLEQAVSGRLFLFRLPSSLLNDFTGVVGWA